MTTTSDKPGLSIGNELTNPDGYSIDNRLTFVNFYKPVSGDFLLLQTGDYLLLQSGGKIILEAA